MTTQTTTTPHRFIGLFTEDGLDQICSTTAEAHRETRDLRAMGCDVSRYEAADESTLYAIDTWMRDGVPFATARNRVESGTLHPDTVAEAAGVNPWVADAEATRTPCPVCNDQPPIQVAPGTVCSCPECGPYAPAKAAEAAPATAEAAPATAEAAPAKAAEAAPATAEAAPATAEAAPATAEAAPATAEAAPATTPPARLNGRPLVKFEAHPNGFFTVMTTQADHDSSGAAYCVATWWPELGTTWQWGHYCETRADAVAAFHEVATRNAERGRAYTTTARLLAEGMADAGRAPRSLSAAATPAHLRAGYVAETDAEAAEAPQTATTGQGGAFPLRAVPRAVYDIVTGRAADRCAEAIEDSLALFGDWADPAESVRYGVGLPEARETVAVWWA